MEAMNSDAFGSLLRDGAEVTSSGVSTSTAQTRIYAYSDLTSRLDSPVPVCNTSLQSTAMPINAVIPTQAFHERHTLEPSNLEWHLSYFQQQLHTQQSVGPQVETYLQQQLLSQQPVPIDNGLQSSNQLSVPETVIFNFAVESASVASNRSSPAPNSWFLETVHLLAPLLDRPE
ncbi:MAG: hypothetical protein J3Q66DRAFT_367280 [Benniella sp.]|nr:MAG: hypothetical protein J3Q66DRAFT_367280 [Benniella sp.]